MKSGSPLLPALVDLGHAGHGVKLAQQGVGEEFPPAGDIRHFHGVVDVGDHRHSLVIDHLDPARRRHGRPRQAVAAIVVGSDRSLVGEPPAVAAGRGGAGPHGEGIDIGLIQIDRSLEMTDPVGLPRVDLPIA